ncbi:hypothetical protein DL93DRAFT_2172057 [Clavulina sp. PMI_390]|nr:hypothetical protein DL93DRAFT_2172057 [Clavulina sp. PMI_390]
MSLRWNKRKRDDDDGEFGGDRGGGAQALPVADSLAPDGIPRDGAEYLLTVRMADAKLPNFTKVPNPFGGLSETKGFTKAPRGLKHPSLPSEEWKLQFQQRLQAMRENLINAKIPEEDIERARLHRLPDSKDRPGWFHFLFGPQNALPKPTTTRTIKTEITDHIKEEDDEADEDEFIGTQPAILDFDDASTSDEEEPEAPPSTAAPVSKPLLIKKDTERASGEVGSSETPAITSSAKIFKPVQPSAALLKRINQYTVQHLLMFYEYWMRQALDGEDVALYTPSTNQASSSTEPIAQPIISPFHLQWLLALLTRYQNDLMDSNHMSNLRSLARASIALICVSLERERTMRTDLVHATPHRGSNPPDDGYNGKQRDGPSGRAGLWMVVAAVATVWGQADLWDEANDSLHQLDDSMEWP